MPVADRSDSPAYGGNRLASSLEAMLDLGTFAEREGRSVREVIVVDFSSADSLSGSRFLRVQTHGPGGTRSYVVKRVSRSWDWIMRATDDRRGRAVVAWTSGLLDDLPAETTAEVAACCVDGDGWAILLNDVGPCLVASDESVVADAVNVAFLDAMAALHAAWWEQPERADPALGFLSLPGRYREFAPAVSLREAGSLNPIPPLIGRGWERCWEVLDRRDPGMGTALRGLLADAAPLAEALAVYPQTVIHGDWKFGNLGLHPAAGSRGPRTILLDWAVVGPAPPGVDLAWYLAVNCDRLPITKEEAERCYVACLERRLGTSTDGFWAAAWELALLGGFLQLGWAKALGLQDGPSGDGGTRPWAEFTWWIERIAPPLQRLAGG